MKKNVLCLVVICVLVLGQVAIAQQYKKVGFAQSNINPRSFARGPDLAVTQLVVYPPTRASKGYYRFTAVVKNVGSTYIPTTRAFMRVGGETRPREYTIPALRPGASKTISRYARLTIPRVYRVTVKADSKYQVKEINEKNNEQYKNFTVRRSASTPIINSQMINHNYSKIPGPLRNPIITPKANTFKVTSVSTYGRGQNRVPITHYKGKVLFIVTFNRPVKWDTMRVGHTLKVDVRRLPGSNGAAGQEVRDIGGWHIFYRDYKKVVFVSHQKISSLLNLQAQDRLEFKISLCGTGVGNGAVRDTQGEPLDGDNDGQPGGNFSSTHFINM